MARRFEYIPLGPERQSALSGLLVSSVTQRIQAGLDVNGNPARPLSKSYQKAKIKRGLRPIRDWTWSGATLRALRAVSSGIGIMFDNQAAARTASILNRESQQFGISKTDREAVARAIDQTKAERIRIV